MTPSAGSPHRPLPLLLATGLAALQALFFLGWALLELLDLTPGRATMAVTVAVFFLAYGAALALCVWGLLSLRSWARSPVVLTQLLQLGIAWNLRDTPALAVPLAVVAVAVVVGIFHPASLAAVEGEEQPPA